MQCRFFFTAGGLEGVCDTLNSTGSENQHISKKSRLGKQIKHLHIYLFIFVTADSPDFMNTANRKIH